MVIIYEVTLHLDREIAEEYDAWLKGHVAEMLTLPGFVDAEISTIEESGLAADEIGRVVYYRLENRAALDDYFRDHAARMRDDGTKRFGSRVRASRRILAPLP